MRYASLNLDMSTCCDHERHTPVASPTFRRALWIALALNAAMFAVEIGAGVRANSVSLLADAADFLGDAVNYGLSLAALALAAVWRSRVAWLKGATMALYGIGVLAIAGWNALHGAAPEPLTSRRCSPRSVCSARAFASRRIEQ
jgi:Co/Zn/Cd efflux system component